MATCCQNHEEGGTSTTKMKKNLNIWKFPKIPIDKVYKNKTLRFFPSYVIKDFEETITLKSSNVNVSSQLLTKDYLQGFVKKQHKFVHLGLVQVAIKSLMRDGLEAPIIVCLRDGRHGRDFKSSLLAIVETNLSKGSFYFNCFPSFSVSLTDMASLEALTLNVKSSGVPLALTYRVVCKAMVDLSSEALEEPMLGETTYVQVGKLGSGESRTKWDDVQVPESWTRREDPEVARNRNSLEAVRLPDGRVLMRFPSARDETD